MEPINLDIDNNKYNSKYEFIKYSNNTIKLNNNDYIKAIIKDLIIKNDHEINNNNINNDNCINTNSNNNLDINSSCNSLPISLINSIDSGLNNSFDEINIIDNQNDKEWSSISLINHNSNSHDENEKKIILINYKLIYIKIKNNLFNFLKSSILFIKRLPKEILKMFIDNSLLSLWMFVNLVSLLMNQSLEENYNFTFYNSLIGFQLIICFLISNAYIYIKKRYNFNGINDIVSIEMMENNILESPTSFIKTPGRFEMIRIILPLSFIYVINCIISSLVNESIVEFSKTVVPLTVVGLQYIITKKRYAKTFYYSMVVLVFGTGIFLLDESIEELSNFKQIMLSVLIISFISLTLIYSHTIFSTKLSLINPINIINYFSPCSFIMLLPFIINEMPLVFNYVIKLNNENPLNLIYNVIICLIISGIFAYFTFYITFIANKKYNILVMSISRNSKSILLKLFSSQFVFQNETLSFGNWLGFALSSIGVFMSYQDSLKEDNINNNNSNNNIKYNSNSNNDNNNNTRTQ